MSFMCSELRTEWNIASHRACHTMQVTLSERDEAIPRFHYVVPTPEGVAFSPRPVNQGRLRTQERLLRLTWEAGHA